MSAVILNQSVDASEDDADRLLERIQIVSLATGTKSLPVSALSKCKGLILHDCHAEILALRGFNYWLLTEMQRMLESDSYSSAWLEFTAYKNEDRDLSQNSHSFPCRLRKGVEVSLFSTEAPCGDASMELLMSATEAAGRDITPWPTTTAEQDISASQLPPGRGCFSNLGALRRKPARADAEISMSKSCTDKLMLKQFTGLLGCPARSFIEPTEEAFLKRMVVYEDRWNSNGYTRAFGAKGRLNELLSTIQQGGTRRVVFFGLDTLPQGFKRFEFEKAAEGLDGNKSRASNVSALWVAELQGNTGVVEVILNGVKQGFKQFDDRERKGSVVCRKNMIQEGLRIESRLQERSDCLDYRFSVAGGDTLRYSELKVQDTSLETALLKQKVLDGLGGWPQKEHEDDFNISMIPPRS